MVNKKEEKIPSQNLKFMVGGEGIEGGLELRESSHQRLGDILAAKSPEAAESIRPLQRLRVELLVHRRRRHLAGNWRGAAGNGRGEFGEFGRIGRDAECEVRLGAGAS